MSEASNRNFGLEQRHRERRMAYNLLNPGAQSVLPDPGMDSFYGAMFEHGPMNLSGFGTQGSSRPAPARGGDDEVARSWALNTALSDLQDDRRVKEQSLRSLTADADMREEAARQASAPREDRAAVDRAFALSRTGQGVIPAEIVQSPDGSYASRGTGPVADPQRVLQENLPGHLQPVAKPVTFGKPEKMLVGGKPQFVREGSDGQMYGLDRRPVDPATIAPPDEPIGALETVVGPDGKPIRVRARDAVGKTPGAGTEKSSTGVQKRVLNFFNRAEQADGELEKLEPEIQKMGRIEQGRMEWLPNFAQSQTGQSYLAAQRAFTEARLRKDSGAAIPPHEFESDRQTYFAQPFDSKETLEQKRRARAAMLSSLAFESGQALGEFVGDADEAKSILQRYKDRAAGKSASDAPGKPKSDPLGIR
jgi:hypothetical protein